MVVGCQKGMAEQRIPNMKGIMGARTKPLKVVEPVAAESLTERVSFELPPAKEGVKMVPPITRTNWSACCMKKPKSFKYLFICSDPLNSQQFKFPNVNYVSSNFHRSRRRPYKKSFPRSPVLWRRAGKTDRSSLPKAFCWEQ